MSKPYKAIQSKALHNGAYLAYAKMDSTIYTTNGQIMVRHKAEPHELKPLKNQLDNRELAPMDMEFILSKIQEPSTYIAKVQDEEEWTNEAGLKCTRAYGTNHHGKVSSVSVQQMYVDYVNALFEDAQWWIGETTLVATDKLEAGSGKWPTILAIIAPVREDS